MVSRLNTLIKETTDHLDNFEFHYAGRKLMSFVVNDLSRFYIKLIRDRVWVSESGKDKSAALSVLYESLLTVSKLLAPITPFISEEIHQNLSSNTKSIFTSDWPKIDKKKFDKELEEEIEICRKIIDACLSARQGTNIKLRWPVREFLIQSEDKKVVSAVKDLKDIITFISNSKSIHIIKEISGGEYSEVEFDFGKVFVSKVLDKDLLEEALLRELTREIQEMRKKNRFQVKETIVLSLKSDQNTNKLLEKLSKTLEKEVGAKEINIGELKGDFTSKLQFEDKSIEIAFDKIIGQC
jgi:isoleucyl-tRNA synthetase